MPLSSAAEKNMISVVMPVYNGGELLSEAIYSILGQSYANFEFIIIDDASTDNSRQIIEAISDERIKLLTNEQNLGVTQTLNKGISSAKGFYIARHDCDDIALPTRLEKQVNFLKNHQDIACVGCNLVLIDVLGNPTGQWEYPSSHALVSWKQLFNSAIAHPASMFKLDVFKQIGGYNEEIKRAQDFELWSRMASTHKLANVPEVLVKYRIHPNAISQSKAQEQVDYRKQISSNNIASLSRALSEYDFVSPNIRSHAELNEYKENVFQLRDRFFKRHDLNNEDIQSINEDIDNMIIEQFIVLSNSEKLKTVLSVPLSDKRRYLPHLIPESVKQKVKKILKK